MTSTAPRWLAPRAARLGAALIETFIDARGHAALLARLSSSSFQRAFARALALDDTRALLPLLERGLAPDHERLGLVVDAGARKLSLLGRAGVLLPPPDAPLPAPPANAPDDKPAPPACEARLGALLVASRGTLPGPFAYLSRLPGRGPRAGLALAILADLVFLEAPDEALLSLALGSSSGDPAPVPLLVYDDVITALESMLHAPRREDTRIAPLAALFFETERLVDSAPPADLSRVLRAEHRLSRDLGGFTRAGPSAEAFVAPKLPKRPTRKIVRDPRSYRPVSLAPFGEEWALEDLFLP